MDVQLGHMYRCRITGFKGVATGRVEYITGCRQALLSPRVTESGAWVDAQWFDYSRLEEVAGIEPIVLNEEPAQLGFDLSAPRI